MENFRSQFTLGGTTNRLNQLAHISLVDGWDNTCVGLNTEYCQGINNTVMGAYAGTGSDDRTRDMVIMGIRCAQDLVYSSNSVVVGSRAARSAQAVHYSVMLGADAGSEARGAFHCTVIGYSAGANMVGGLRNTYVGSQSGMFALDTSDNTFVGESSGVGCQYGYYNVCVGAGSGQGEKMLSNNVLIGHLAGGNVNSSNDNIGIGSRAMHSARGTMNVCVGTRVGHDMFGNTNTVIGSHSCVRSHIDYSTVVGNYMLNCSDGSVVVMQSAVCIGQNIGVRPGTAPMENFLAIGGNFDLGDEHNETFIVRFGDNTLLFANGVSISVGQGATWSGNSVVIGTGAGSADLGENTTAVGFQAGNSASGGYNTFLGTQSGLGSEANAGVMVGYQAGKASVGNHNTFLGPHAAVSLKGNTNTTVGAFAASTLVGDFNITLGAYVADSLQGDYNTALGSYAAYSVIGEYNITLGAYAAESLKGDSNTVLGVFAANALVGNLNTVAGANAAVSMEGNTNTVFGSFAASTVVGNFNTTLGAYVADSLQGDFNTALGSYAANSVVGEYNTTLGAFAAAYMTGNSNIVAGGFAGSAARSDRSILIGHQVAGRDNPIDSVTRGHVYLTDSIVLGVDLNPNNMLRSTMIGTRVGKGVSSTDSAVIGTDNVNASVMTNRTSMVGVALQAKPGSVTDCAVVGAGLTLHQGAKNTALFGQGVSSTENDSCVIGTRGRNVLRSNPDALILGEHLGGALQVTRERSVLSPGFWGPVVAQRIWDAPSSEHIVTWTDMLPTTTPNTRVVSGELKVYAVNIYGDKVGFASCTLLTAQNGFLHILGLSIHKTNNLSLFSFSPKAEVYPAVAGVSINTDVDCSISWMFEGSFVNRGFDLVPVNNYACYFGRSKHFIGIAIFFDVLYKRSLLQNKLRVRHTNGNWTDSDTARVEPGYTSFTAHYGPGTVCSILVEDVSQTFTTGPLSPDTLFYVNLFGPDNGNPNVSDRKYKKWNSSNVNDYTLRAFEETGGVYTSVGLPNRTGNERLSPFNVGPTDGDSFSGHLIDRDQNTTSYTVTAWVYNKGYTVHTPPLDVNSDHYHMPYLSQQIVSDMEGTTFFGLDFMGCMAADHSRVPVPNMWTTVPIVREGTPITVNTWIHYAVTFDAESRVMTLYKNGWPVSTGEHPDSSGPGLRYVTIGAFEYESSTRWNGSLDDVRLISRCVSQAEVRCIMSAYACSAVIPPLNPTLWLEADTFLFNAGKTTWMDLSNNSYDITLEGTLAEKKPDVFTDANNIKHVQFPPIIPFDLAGTARINSSIGLPPSPTKEYTLVVFAACGYQTSTSFGPNFSLTNSLASFRMLEAKLGIMGFSLAGTFYGSNFDIRSVLNYDSTFYMYAVRVRAGAVKQWQLLMGNGQQTTGGGPFAQSPSIYSVATINMANLAAPPGGQWPYVHQYADSFAPSSVGENFGNVASLMFFNRNLSDAELNAIYNDHWNRSRI